MKNVYIIASHNPTKMGGFIRLITRYYYNHTSFAFHEDLSDLMSFARYYHEISLVGGFVHENNQRMANGIIQVYRCEVDDKSYEDIKYFIETIEKHPTKYRYNLINAFLSPLKKDIKIENYHTCIEFVSKILVLAKYLEQEGTLSTKEICTLLEEKKIYEGAIENYADQLIYNDEYAKHFSWLERQKKTINAIIALYKSYKNQKSNK